jgi:UDP-N-acetylmuramate-alanine ligase
VEWQAHDLEPAGASTRFKVRRGGMPFGAFELPMVGAYNVRNATAAIAVATAVGIGPERIAEGLSPLPASNGGSRWSVWWMG